MGPTANDVASAGNGGYCCVVEPKISRSVFFDDQRDAERHEDLCGGILTVERTQQHAIEDHRKQGDGNRSRDERGPEAPLPGDDEADVCADRIECPVCEIHQAQRSEDDGQPDGDSDVDETENQPVQQGLRKSDHVTPCVGRTERAGAAECAGP